MDDPTPRILIFRLGPCADNSNLMDKTHFLGTCSLTGVRYHCLKREDEESGHHGQADNYSSIGSLHSTPPLANFGIDAGWESFSISHTTTNRCKFTIIWQPPRVTLRLTFSRRKTGSKHDTRFEWYCTVSRAKPIVPTFDCLGAIHTMFNGLNGEWCQRSGRCDSVTKIYLWHSRRADGYQKLDRNTLPLPTQWCALSLNVVRCGPSR